MIISPSLPPPAVATLIKISYQSLKSLAQRKKITYTEIFSVYYLAPIKDAVDQTKQGHKTKKNRGNVFGSYSPVIRLFEEPEITRNL